MSDIVDRLSRTLSDLAGDDDALFAEINEQRHEAIAEINRLRAMIAWMENMDPRLVDDARAALAKKEKK